MGKYLALQRVRAYFGLKEILEEKRMSSYLIQKFLQNSFNPNEPYVRSYSHTKTISKNL
jgi:hypothetical protein